MKENEILITDTNKLSYINEYKKAMTLVALKTQQDIIKNRILEVEQEIVNTGFKVIGVSDSNIRISVTPGKETSVINYHQTLENNQVSSKKYGKNVETILTTFELNKTKIEKDFKDKLAYDIKTKKPVVVLRILKKGE